MRWLLLRRRSADVQVRVARCVNEGEVDALAAPAAAATFGKFSARVGPHVMGHGAVGRGTATMVREAPTERPRAALWAGARQPWLVRVVAGVGDPF